MIQRKQTLYFLAIVVSCVMLLFADISFYELTAADEIVSVEYDSTEITEDGSESSVKNSFLTYFIMSVGILALITLLMFKNRKLQAKLSAINFLFIIAVLIMMYYYSMGMDYFEDTTSEGGLSFYALVPLALLIFNFLGFKGIQSDEKKIRSMDRLR